MGADNGYVAGLVKVHDEGPPSDRFNLVLVAEGYQVGELAQFESDVDDAVVNLFSSPPFDEEAVACGLNVYRLDVVSDESGADDPMCGVDGGEPTTADTYFDATFCSDGEIQRLLAGDSVLVQSTVETYLPEWTAIIVIVNDPQRGGAGGSIAWASTGGFDWKDVIIHELGHSVFGFADEYDYLAGSTVDEPDQANHPGPEPLEVNVTIEPDPTLVKWASLVTATDAVPTMNNADCSSPNNAPSPVALDIVGTFEGAHYFHCDAYRPQYQCKMRDSSDDFCVVCQDVIREFMADYAQPATTGAVTLDTPFVTFDDIPEDTSTVRPVVFTVDTCLPVTFEVTVPPVAPFSVAYGPVVVSTPDPDSVRLARVWIRYDCGNAGTASNSAVSIRLVETDFTWAVPISGNCVPRETAVVQLVFDRSASMLDLTSEGRLKKDVLKDSARVMADVAYEDTGLGANTYDHDAHPLMDIQVAGAVGGGAGRDALRAAIDTYEPNPAGNTATGDGIEFAKAELDAAAGYDNHAMIVLTDGKDTASKAVGEVADGVINQTVFAIGMGTGEQINPETLETLAGATGGYMLTTGLLTEDDTFLLEKFYLQILAGIINNDIIVDPEGRLSPAAPKVRIPFDVAESDIEITAVTVATMTGAIDVALEAPDGSIFGAAEAIANPLMEYAKSQASILVRASLPLVSDGGPQRDGRWHLVLTLDDKIFHRLLRLLHRDVGTQSSSLVEAYIKRIEDLRMHGVKYSAMVQTYSNLNMKVLLTQSSHEPGAIMSASATLTEYGGPFRGSAHVAADVTLPGGAVVKVQFANQGEGLFTAELAAGVPGLYAWRVRANGTTQRERPFTRDQVRTASVWTGGDNPSDGPHPGGAGDGLIDLLCCLYEHGGLTGAFDEHLKEHGVDPDVFRRCLVSRCRHRDPKYAKAPDVGLTSEQLGTIRTRLDRLVVDLVDSLDPSPRSYSGRELPSRSVAAR